MDRKVEMFLGACMASTVLFGTSRAETVTASADLRDSKKTAAYIYARPMLEAMYRQGIEMDRKFGLQLDCHSKYGLNPISTVILSPIEFPDDVPNPIKGAWKFRYQLDRCGDSKVYNALFVANSEGKAPTLSAYFPGSTNASATLIKDAMGAALSNAVRRSGLKDCKEVDVFDMRVTEPAHDVVEGANKFNGVWNESWVFRVCGQMIDVSMAFIPDAAGGGTSFNVD